RADGCPAEPAASRRARQTGVAGHLFCGHAWAATAPRGPSVDVSERQMGLRRLGTESSPDSPLEGSGFELSVPLRRATTSELSVSPAVNAVGTRLPPKRPGVSAVGLASRSSIMLPSPRSAGFAERTATRAACVDQVPFYQ